MAKLVSKTYGDALFELAVESNQTDVYLEEAKMVSSILEKNDELNRLMNHPKIVKEEKIKRTHQRRADGTFMYACGKRPL